MNKHRYSEDLGKTELTGEQGERDLLISLLRADGVHYVGQADQPLTEDSIRVDEQPDAKISYPWNLCDPESEGFFAESEQPSLFDEWQESEIDARAERLFAQLDQQWAAVSLQSSLVQRFAARIPQDLLTTIAAQAQKLVADSRKAVTETLSIADQLVQCVQDLAINLAQDDLYVQARLLEPMRNSGQTAAVDHLLKQIPQTEWQQLSEIQKARLSLVIARFAIDELQSNPEL